MASTINFDESEKVWKSSNYPYASFVNQTIGQVFLETVKKTASSKVVETYYDLGLKKTLSDIYRESVTVAVNLRNLGVQPGDVLVLYSLRNPKISPLAMGSFLMGVTVNFFETKLKKQEAELMLELMSPTLILYEEKYGTVVKEAVSNRKLPNLKQLISIDGSSADTKLDSTLFKPIDFVELEAFVPPTLGNPKKLVAAYLFTSGSTGLPKVACISHSLMLDWVINMWSVPNRSMNLTPDSVVLCLASIRWCSQVTSMLQSLLLGVLRVCPRDNSDGSDRRELIRMEHVTHLFCVPIAFQDILQSTDSSDVDALASLRYIILTGEFATQTVMNLTKQLAINATVYRRYGLTEIGGIANDTKANGGYLKFGVQMKILDDNLKLVGPNEIGQLFVRLPVPILGYLKLQNSDYFDKDGFFKTVDCGFVDENKALSVLGRYKDLVRANGLIIIPKDVESLVDTLPEIHSSIFVGYRRSPADTQDSGALYVMLKNDIQIPFKEIELKISNMLKANLTPAKYEIIKNIVPIVKYPTTTSTKVDRAKLAKMAATTTQNCL